MKKSTILLAFTLLTFSQVFSQNWITDFSKAKEFSASQHKNIMLVFSGSDWCGTCIKMENQIWKSNGFVTYSDKHLILLKVDFPKKKKNRLSDELQAHNDKLAETYQAKFPLVVILDSDGKVLDSFGFIKDFTPQDYINRISKL
ncbi:MAG: thioredoxin family protein [Flavobacteriaceae bacterium]